MQNHPADQEPRRVLGSFFAPKSQNTPTWEQRKISELAEKTYGGGTPTTSNETFWNGNIPWIQSSDIVDGKLMGVEPRKYITQTGLNSSATQLVPKNSIAIITRVGVGKLAYMPFSYSTSQDFLSLSKLNTEPFFTVYLLLSDLDLQGKLNWDWMILLIAKTGIRFSEALAITPADFDFAHQMLSINKTWDYKGNGGFLPTKNKSSVRKIQIDWQTVIQFAALVKDVPEDKPIFVFKEHAYNSTVNDVLERHCDRAKIPVISVHGLRHTHASVLLFAGVSIASVARRLGHSSMTTTQKTYLHIIQELENQDIDLVMRSLSGLS